MFGRIVQTTFRGLLQWPDLMAFGALSFVLTLVMDGAFGSLWRSYDIQVAIQSAPVSPARGILLLVAQQLTLTFVSMLIAVAATRVTLARLRGRPMSILDGLRLRGVLRPVVTYSVLYSLITSLLAVVYLLLLYGSHGLGIAATLAATGISGITQVPTAGIDGPIALILLVFAPLFIGWALANLLAAPVIAEERVGGWSAVARSWTLVRRTISVVVALIASLLSVACVAALFAAFMTAGNGETFSTIRGFDEAVAAAPTLPRLPVVLTAFLTSLVFLLGLLFNSAWYLLAADIPDDHAEFTMH